jgi:hypothetical protein
VLTVKEQVWRFVLEHAKDGMMQQQEVASLLGVSTSTVHHALTVPRRTGAVEVGKWGFRVADRMKLNVIWAVFRNLWRDVILDVWTDRPPGKTEGLVSPFEGVRFTGPSAFKFAFGYVPSDYDHVLAYVPRELVGEIVERSGANISGEFREKSARRSRHVTRLTLLEPDPRLPPDEVPVSQMYVDLWQLPVWWATEFTKRIEEMVFGA